MKDLHKDKRAYNTALNSAKTLINGCNKAKRYVVKEGNKYLVKKEAEKYLVKVEFIEGKIIVEPEIKENAQKKEAPKLKKSEKKVSRKLPDNTNEATA